MIAREPQVTDAARAERQLHDALRRAARQPDGRIALVLHLSRLSPPAPRPHHRRIARAMLQDSAQRHEGEVFALRNGDMVLLCRCAGGGGDVAESVRGAASPDPATLPHTLARLLRLDAPEAVELVTVWRLDRSLDAALAFADARIAEGSSLPPGGAEGGGETGVVDAIGALIATGRIEDLMQLQTAVALTDAADDGSAGRRVLRPLYREVSFSIVALEARIRAGGQASADPFLFRHLAARLDRRMLEVLRERLGTGGPLDLAAARDGDWPAAPLHLNLTLDGVLSDGFRRLAAACRAAGTPLGVEISMIEACGDPGGFARAREAARGAGVTLVLDGLSHLALLLARPAALRPDLLKLDWSPRLPDLAEADDREMRAVLRDFGAHRVILQRAETEAALRWGLAHGIRRFQGRHVDAMLGAGRIVECPLSDGCTLRQCIERASATGPAGRAGCANRALLDAGAPARPADRDAAPRRPGLAAVIGVPP